MKLLLFLFMSRTSAPRGRDSCTCSSRALAGTVPTVRFPPISMRSERAISRKAWRAYSAGSSTARLNTAGPPPRLIAPLITSPFRPFSNERDTLRLLGPAVVVARFRTWKKEAAGSSVRSGRAPRRGDGSTVTVTTLKLQERAPIGGLYQEAAAGCV